MYSVTSFDNLSTNPGAFEELRHFCVLAAGEGKDEPSYPSINPVDWETNTSSLLYVASKGRFDSPNGTFQIIYHEGRPVCVSGAYTAEFDTGVAIIGGRSWTLPEHRSRFLIGDHIIPVQLDWAIMNHHDVAMFTYNPHNAWLAKMILRASSGRALAPGRPNSPVYTGWVAHPTLCRVKNTNQIILYKQLGVLDRMPLLEGIDTKIPNGL